MTPASPPPASEPPDPGGPGPGPADPVRRDPVGPAGAGRDHGPEGARPAAPADGTGRPGAETTGHGASTAIGGDGGDDAPQPPLRHALWLLRRFWLLLVVTTLLGGLLLGGRSALAPATYTAETNLEVVPDVGQQVLGTTASASAEDTQRQTQTLLALASSPGVARAVSQSLFRGRVDPEDLLRQVDPTLDPETNLITIAVTDEDARRAARIANSWASQFVAKRLQARQRQYRSVIRALEAQIGARAASDPRVPPLRSRLRQLRVEAAGTQPGVQVADGATVPTQASGPQTRRDVAIGLVLGLALGLALLMAREALSRPARR